MKLRRLTDPEVLARYGDPAPYLTAEGVPSAEWERAILDWVQLPAQLPLAWDLSRGVRRFRAHRLVVVDLQATLWAIWEGDREAWASLDSFGGCYAWRSLRSNHRLRSRHSWGIAVDLDVAQNQQGDATPEMHPYVIEQFEAHGFIWGGRFQGELVDGMHFEAAARE